MYNRWLTASHNYPHHAQRTRVLDTILHGSSISFTGARESTERYTCPNLSSSKDDPGVIDNWLLDEVKAKRIAGPFDVAPPGIFVSPLGLVAKKPTGYRVIHHLSYPRSSYKESINSNINDLPFKLTRFQDAIDAISILGPGTLMSKIDIKAAYRCVPIRTQDQLLLGMRWQNKWYYDKALPFGLKSSCYIWNDISMIANWVAKETLGIDNLFVYVDDYLVAHGPIPLAKAKVIRDLIVHLFQWLGLPISLNKLEGPSTIIIFLGIEIDTAMMMVRLPAAKLDSLRALVESWLTKKACTQKELRSLIGRLSHASQVVRASRLFITRLIKFHAVTSHITSHVRIGSEVTKDLLWWSMYLKEWNGTSFGYKKWVSSEQINLYTDACTIGCGATFGDHWFSYQWSETDKGSATINDGLSMPYLELLAIVIAISTWSKQLANMQIIIHCD
jgi:hypothetical protein